MKATSNKQQATSNKQQAYKRKSVLIFISLLYLSSSFAQNIGINTTGNTPDASAALDIDMTNKGLLVPRIDLQNLTDVTTIAAPTTSLLVYNTGATLSPAGYYYWSGSAWIPFLTNSVAANAGWSLLGNAGTNAAANFIGTTDAVDWVVKTSGTERMRVLSGGNVAIGTTSADAALDVNGTASFYSDNISIGAITGSANERANISYNGTAKFFLKGLTGVATSIGANGTDDYLFIKTDGNVGIGTTSPNSKLTIKGSNADQLYLDNDASQWTQMYFANNATNKAFMAYDNTNQSWLWEVGVQTLRLTM